MNKFSNKAQMMLLIEIIAEVESLLTDVWKCLRHRACNFAKNKFFCSWFSRKLLEFHSHIPYNLQKLYFRGAALNDRFCINIPLQNAAWDYEASKCKEVVNFRMNEDHLRIYLKKTDGSNLIVPTARFSLWGRTCY